jgi:hypothetical protein
MKVIRKIIELPFFAGFSGAIAQFEGANAQFKVANAQFREAIA